PYLKKDAHFDAASHRFSGDFCGKTEEFHNACLPRNHAVGAPSSLQPAELVTQPSRCSRAKCPLTNSSRPKHRRSTPRPRGSTTWPRKMILISPHCSTCLLSSSQSWPRKSGLKTLRQCPSRSWSLGCARRAPASRG